MLEIKWNDVKCTSSEDIPKGTDLLVTIEDPNSNRKVVTSQYMLHQPFIGVQIVNTFIEATVY